MPRQPSHDAEEATTAMIRLTGTYRAVLVRIADEDHRPLKKQVEWLIDQEAKRRDIDLEPQPEPESGAQPVAASA